MSNRRPNRCGVWSRSDGEWDWLCGWSTCRTGGTERTQAAAIDEAHVHLHQHATFGIRPKGAPRDPAPPPH